MHMNTLRTMIARCKTDGTGFYEKLSYTSYLHYMSSPLKYEYDNLRLRLERPLLAHNLSVYVVAHHIIRLHARL